MTSALPPAVDAALADWHSDGCGRVAFYADTAAGSGTPLLLLHSINAAPSAYEMKPLFEHYRGERGRRGNKLPRGFQRAERLERG